MIKWIELKVKWIAMNRMDGSNIKYPLGQVDCGACERFRWREK